MFDWSLTIQNNTGSVVRTPLFQPSAMRGAYNSRIRFACDLTGADLSADEVSIDVYANADPSNTTTYTAPLLDHTVQGVVNALNSLSVGVFWLVGNEIRTANSLYTYSQLTIGAGSDAGLVWVIRASAADNSWSSITFGNGLFVAVSLSGVGNRVMTSPDGINWTIRVSAADVQWSGVVFAAGIFVAVASSGIASQQVMTSPDGINWTSQTAAASRNWTSVTYGAGLFVAVANNGLINERVMTSPDGITWTLQTASALLSWQDVIFAGGQFVAVAQFLGTPGGMVMTSPDGINWTNQNASDMTAQWLSIAYGAGIYVAVGSPNNIMYSPDAVNWTNAVTPPGQWLGVTYGNGLFVAVTQFGTSGFYVVTSPDAVTWTLRATPANNAWSSVSYANDIFVAVSSNGVGNRVMTSGVKI